MSISNKQDTIDSREIIDRIEELEELRDEAIEAMQEDHAKLDPAEPNMHFNKDVALDDLSEWGFDEDDAEELKVLKALAEEAEGYASDWKHGVTLIHEDYFTEYCEEFVQDIGDLPREIPSYLVINWNATAENLKEDYSSVDFDGETYLVR